jgi:hypothetical protein
VTVEDGMKEQSSEVHNILLNTGDVYRFKLGGLGSAGYDWDYSIEGDEGIVAVSAGSPSPPPKPVSPDLPPDSYSLEYVLLITALKPGNVRIRLSLRRSWEKLKPPIRETTVEINVK